VIEQLRALYSMTMFHRLKFTLPPHINASDVPHSARMMSLGYRHMCRFHSGLMYTHAALADYDWCVQRPRACAALGPLRVRKALSLRYLRLDSDSFLLLPLQYDPFRFMQERRLNPRERVSSALSVAHGRVQRTHPIPSHPIPSQPRGCVRHPQWKCHQCLATANSVHSRR
jgi:hypothetical protein